MEALWRNIRPLVVTDRAPWNKKDASFGEYVELTDPETKDAYQFSLGRGSTVDVPENGTPVVVTLGSFVRQDAEIGESGKAYIARKVKYRILDLKAA